MNGSSGFRGLPMTRSGAADGSSSSSSSNHNHMNAAAVDNRPPWMTTTDMNLALRASFYPRLDLATQLYSQFPNAAAVSAAAAHLSGLHAAAAANSAATNAPNMPPPLSPYHPANAGQHPGSTIAHQALLSQYFYSNAYGAGNGPTPFGAAPGRPPYLPVDSAFLPTGSAVPRYRYLLPTSPSNDPNSAAAAVAAAARIRNSFAAAANSTLERTMSETSETMTNRFLNRKPYSPPTTTTNVGGGPSTTVNDNVSAFYHQQNLVNSAANSSNECLNASRSGGGNSSSTAAAGQQQQHHQTSADVRRSNRLTSASLPTQPYYPSHFMKGTVIQLANGDLKRVEDLNTEDFVRSAHLTNDLKIDSSTVVKIEEKSAEIVLLSFAVGELKVNVSVEATVEHPFFVIGQGWSSCNPERTQNLYGLPCQRLQVGDICISLTHRDVSSGKQPPQQPPQQQQQPLTPPKLSSSNEKLNVDSNMNPMSGGGRSQTNVASTKIGSDVPFSSARSSTSSIQTRLTGGGGRTTSNVKRSIASIDDRGVAKRQKLNASKLVSFGGISSSSSSLSPSSATALSSTNNSTPFIRKLPSALSTNVPSTKPRRSLTPPADWTHVKANHRRRRRMSLP